MASEIDVEAEHGGGDELQHITSRIKAVIVKAEDVACSIGNALERGDRVELRGFGAFSVRHREARTGRNPRTGASVEVAEKKVPFFKMGKGMRERLNR